MALPVRIERERLADPSDIVRGEFGDFLNRFFRMGLLSEDPQSALGVLGSYGVDIREDEDHVYIEADLPGFDKKDVDLSLDGGILTITAQRHDQMTEPPPPQQGQQKKQAQSEGRQGNYLLRERRMQRFVRSFTLPPNVDEQNVQARLENGVLMITLNKRPESKPKHIRVS